MIAGDTLAEILQTELNARKPKNWDNICCSYNMRLDSIFVQVFARYDEYEFEGGNGDLRLDYALAKEAVYVLPYKEIIDVLDQRFKEDLDSGYVPGYTAVRRR